MKGKGIKSNVMMIKEHVLLNDKEYYRPLE